MNNVSVSSGENYELIHKEIHNYSNGNPQTVTVVLDVALNVALTGESWSQ
jgi:hypothetical protein